MQVRTTLAFRLAFVPVVAFQLSCGDPSGPRNVATTMSANSATTLDASTGMQISERPSVVVFDQAGARMPGVTVTFATSGSGGTITGGSQVTDAQGVATVGGWTLGTTPGAYMVIASSAGLSPVTFTATATDPCAAPPTSLSLGVTVDGTLSASDCRLSDGSYIDFFELTLPAAGTYLFTETSSQFDTFLFLSTTTDAVLGVHDDISSTNTNSALKAILPAGTFRLGATSFAANETGNYTVSSASSTSGITNCEEVWVARGISTSQELQTTDCTPTGSSGGTRWDNYFIVLPAGQSITVTMSSSTIDCLIEVYDLQAGTAASRLAFRECSADTATLQFTPTSTSLYVLRATSVGTGVTGSYTLAVQ